MEDDYDGDFRYDRAPVGALQGLDPERVAYTGSVSKSLAPGLRLGWLLAPASLTDELTDRKRTMDLGNPAVDQAVLADFIARGGYDRQLRRCQRAYRERRDVLTTALAEHFPGTQVSGIAAGLHIIARLPERYGPEAEFIARAEEDRIALRPLSDCGATRSDDGSVGLVLGYAHLSPHGHRTRRAAAGRGLSGKSLRRRAGYSPRVGVHDSGGREGGPLAHQSARPTRCPGGPSMPSRPRFPSPDRRTVLRGSLAASAALALPVAGAAAPAFARSGRPDAAWGVQVGDVTSSSALVWVRSDRPSPDGGGDIGDGVVPACPHLARPAAGSRYGLHRDDAVVRAAARRAGALPGDARRSGRSPPHRRTGVRHLPDRGRTAAGRCAISVVRRYRGPGMGHQPGHRGLPGVRRDAPPRPRLLPLQRGQHLRGRGDRAACDAARRACLAQRHHRGEGEGRRDTRRVPGELPLQPAGRQPPKVQRAGSLGDSVGRPRGAQQLVSRADPR